MFIRICLNNKKMIFKHDSIGIIINNHNELQNKIDD